MKSATFCLYKKLSVITKISPKFTTVYSTKLSKFSEIANNFEVIELTTSGNSVRCWNKYKNLLLSLGFQETSCQYYHSNVFGNPDIMSGCTTFTKA